MSETTSKSASSDNGAGCGCLLIIGLIIGGCVWIWNAIDDGGYIAHTQSVNLYMKGDWLQNESRECQGTQLHEQGRSTRINAIFCPALAMDELIQQTPHKISIKFFGKISRRDVSPNDEIYAVKFHWRCERSSNLVDGDHFTCYALD